MPPANGPERFDPYHKWLGIPPQDQPPNHYRLLAVQLFESDADVIEDAAQQRMAHVRTYQLGQHVDLSQKVLNKLAAAKACLLNAEQKAAYHTKLRQQLASSTQPSSAQPGDSSTVAGPDWEDLDFLNTPATTPTASPKGMPTVASKPKPSQKKPVWLGVGIAGAAVVVLVVVLAATLGRGGKEVASTVPASPVKATNQTENKSATPEAKPAPKPPRGVEPKAEPKPASKPQASVEPKSEPKAKPEPERKPEPLAVVPAATTLPSKEIAVDLGGGVKLEMVLIPAGEFMMGSPDSDKDAKGDEKPQHRVRITRPFYLGSYEVTQAEYKQLIGINPSVVSATPLEPSAFNPPLSELDQKLREQYLSVLKKQPMELGNTSRYSVESVSWSEAVKFCRRLSDLPQEKAAGHVYRLPTEAEWEYACRAGRTTRYFFGDDDSSLGAYAWFNRNYGGQPHAVNEKRPNAWGLYGMYGCGRQWCADLYDAGYYAACPVDDPTGPRSGAGCVCRGSACGFPPNFLRSATRSSFDPNRRSYVTGFRVAREATTAVAETRLPKPASPLKIQPISPLTVEARKPISVMLSVENAEQWKGKLRYSLGPDAPPGAKIDPETGMLSWTPPLDHAAGTENVTASVASQDGQRDQASFMITLTKPNVQGAIAAGVEWISQQQKRDGSWILDAESEPHNNSIAATSLALLSILGNVSREQSSPYKATISKGVAYLVKQMRFGKHIGDLRGPEQASMYVQGLATMALCEACIRTNDFRLRHNCQAAVDFIVNAQHTGGGWRYAPGQVGDTSVTGWQVSALTLAANAKVKVPNRTLEGVRTYLDSVQLKDGALYSYTQYMDMPNTRKTRAGPSRNMTAIGLLCRMHLGWDSSTPALKEGIRYISQNAQSANDDVYFNYYATRLMYRYGGEEWGLWQAATQGKLTTTQEKDGTWAVQGPYSKNLGRLGVTSFCLMTLEVGQQ